MKDLYSSSNQNSEHINQDSSLRCNKTSSQQQTNSETLEQQKSNSWTPVGPTDRQIIRPLTLQNQAAESAESDSEAESFSKSDDKEVSTDSGLANENYENFSVLDR